MIYFSLFLKIELRSVCFLPNISHSLCDTYLKGTVLCRHFYIGIQDQSKQESPMESQAAKKIGKTY